MVLLLLLLSALLGALPEECQGLQAGFEYQYQYTGTIATFIPNDPKQFSGSALRADVALQLTPEGDVLVKMSHIEVAERNGKGECEANKHADFTFRGIETQEGGAADAALLETPFRVHIDTRQRVSYMEVPEEPVWVSNIRSGVINTIPIIPLTGQTPPTLTYVIREDTIIGDCLNWYSMLQLPDHQATLENKKQEEIIEVDAQRETSASYKAPAGKGRKGAKTSSKTGRKTSSKTHGAPAAELQAPTIEDTLSVLTRTLDSDMCKEKRFNMKINANQQVRERTQRNSEGTFLVRGEGTALRLERGEVDGDIIIYTGDSGEYLQTTSKQVLQLRAVTQVEETLAITYEPQRRTVSFSVADGPRPTIKEKLTGLAPVEQQINANMQGIVDDISDLISENNTVETEPPHFALQTFQRLVERLTIASWSEVEELISTLAKTDRDKEIILQAFVAGGGDQVMSGLLDKMKDRSFRASHPWLVFQVLESPTTPVRSPGLIPVMLEVVNDMVEEEKVSKATSLINIARLANRYCINPKTANRCDPGCDTDFIANTFLPVLVQGLQDPVKWKRLLNVQAVCYLGSPYSLDFLQPLIDGSNTDDIDVRTAAIFCLKSERLPATAQGAVFNALMPVMNNPTEFPEVRSIALLTMSTWQPEISWWEHVAVSTWKEKSPQVVSFISSLLTSLSEVSDPRSNNAKKVVRLAKHPRESDRDSFAKSAVLYLDEVVKNCQQESTNKMAWLSSTKSSFPRAIYNRVQLVTTLGMTKTEQIGFVSNAGSFLQYYEALLDKPKAKPDTPTFREIYEELKEQLELQVLGTTDIRDSLSAILYISDPVPLIFSLAADQNIVSLLRSAALQKLPIHFRLQDTALGITSDLGLPVLVKHEEDIAITPHYSLFPIDASDLLPQNMGLDFGFSLHVNNHNAVKVKTLVPWRNGLAVGAGVEASLDIKLPLTKISWRGGDSGTVINVEVLSEQQMNLVSRTNIMYTSQTPLYYVTDTLLTPEEESRDSSPGRRRVGDRMTHEFDGGMPGVGLQMHLKSDRPFPQENTLYLKNKSVLELKYRNFDYKVILDPETLFTKKVKFTFTGDVKERRTASIEQVRGQDQQTQGSDDFFSQMSQGADDYEMFSQVSQSSSAGLEGFVEVSGVSGFDEQEQDTQTLSSHLEKMQAMMMPHVVGGKVYTFTVVVEPADTPVKMEMGITMAASEGNIGDVPTNIQKIHVTLLSDILSAYLPDTSQLICLDLRTETPILLPLATKEILLEMNLASNFLFNIFTQSNCEGPPVLKLEGSLGVSPAAIQNMPPTQEGDTCDGSFPAHIYPFYNQVSFKISTSEAVPGNIARLIEQEMEYEVYSVTYHIPPETENEVTVDAVWNKGKKEWNITMAEPKRTTVFRVPGDGLEVYDAFLGTGRVCHLTQQSVKTYDELLHPFEPSSCWTTATIIPTSPVFSNGGRHDIAVQVRFTDQWEVRLTSPTYALVLDVTRRDILVNEEEFSGHSDKFSAHRWQDSQIVKLGKVGVRVGDTVDIMVPEFYYANVMGICGNYDGEPANDMMGPSGCLHTDSALLTAAWNTPGVGCSRFTLRNEKRPLAEFRETCNRVIFQPTGVSQQNAMINCTEWKYDERTDPTGLYCKSKVPTPACRPGCQFSGSSAEHIGYNCLRPIGVGGAKYGENDQCFSTVSPIPVMYPCYHQ